MKRMYAILLLSALLAAGCAGGLGMPGLGSLPNLNLGKGKEFVIADLDTAISKASTATDLMAKQRVECHTTIKGIVESVQVPVLVLPTLESETGAFSIFEGGAQVVEAADAVGNFSLSPTARVDLANSCGPLQVRAKGVFARFLSKFVPGF